MSFNRAAIKRFNEESSCAPPPTKYDPKLPHGSSAKNINFGQYSGRSDPNAIHKEGNDDENVFVTPLKPARGRTLVIRSASVRSCSDSRIKKESRSNSSKSIHDIPLAATVTTEDTRLVEVQAELQAKSDLCATLETELRRAKDEVVEKEDLAKSLAEQLEEYKKEVQEKDSEAERVKSEMKSFTDETNEKIQQLQEVLEASKMQIQTKEHEAELLQQANMELNHKLEEAMCNHNSEKEELLGKVKSADEEILNVKLSNENLRSELAKTQEELSICKDEIDEKTASIGSMRDQLQSKDDLCSSLQHQLESANKEKIEMEDKLKTYAGQLDEYKETIENQNSELGTLKIALDDANLKFEKAARDHESEKQELLGKVDEFQQETLQWKSRFESLQKQHAETEEEFILCKDEIDEKTTYISSLKDQLQSKADLCSTLQLQVESANKEKTEMEDLLKANGDLLEDYKNTIGLKESELDALKMAIENLNVKLEQATKDHESEKQALLVKVEEFQEEILQWKSSFQNLQKQQIETEEELILCKNEIDEKGAHINSMNDQLQSKADLCLSLQLQLEGANKEKIEMEDKLKDYANQLEECKTTIELMNSEFDAQKVAMDEVNFKLEKATAEHDSEKQELFGKVDEAQQEISQWKSEFENLLQQHAATEEELNICKKEIDEKVADITSLSDQLQSKVDLCSSLQLQIDSGNNERLELETQLKGYVDQLEGYKNTIELRDSELEALKIAMDDANLKFENAARDHESEKQELLGKVDEFQEEISQWKSQFEVLHQQHSATLEELNLCKTEIDDKTANINSMSGQLQSQVDLCLSLQLQLEDANKEKIEMEDQLKVYANQLEDYKNIIGWKDSEFDALKVELDVAKHVLVTAARQHESEKQKLMEQVEGFQKEISERKSEFEILLQEHAATEEELNICKKEIDEKTTYISSMKDQLQSQVNLCSSLQVQLDSGNNERLELEAQLKAYADQLEEFKRIIGLKDSEFNALKIAMDGVNLKLENATKAHESVKQALLEKVGEFQEEISHWKSSFQSLQKQHAETSEELDFAKTQAEEQAAVIAAMTEELNKLKEISTEDLESKIRELTLENQSLNEHLAHYKQVYGDYAKLVGHQNSKQKIQHIMNIKEENIKLRDEVTHLRKKNGELMEKLKHATTPGARRRFDPSQAFKPILKEPYIQDDRDVRGPDARSTFTVSKKVSHPTPTVKIVDSTKKESKQGMAFDLTFAENKENKGK